VVALLGVLQFIHVVREAVDGGEDFHEQDNAIRMLQVQSAGFDSCWLGCLWHA
jgi:hypothetical protein